MTKYLLIVDFQPGVSESPMEEWKPEEVEAHLDYYRALSRELTASGELVHITILTGPDMAKVVTSDGNGVPVVTDGPFQEFKQWVAGFQDLTWTRKREPWRSRRCTRRARRGWQTDPATDPGAPDHGGLTLQLRRWRATWRPHGRSPLTLAPDLENLLRDLAPRVLGSLTRQFGDFDEAEDAVQEALIAAADHWPQEGVPTDPYAWLMRTGERRLIDQRRSDHARTNREI